MFICIIGSFQICVKCLSKIKLTIWIQYRVCELCVNVCCVYMSVGVYIKLFLNLGRRMSSSLLLCCMCRLLHNTVAQVAAECNRSPAVVFYCAREMVQRRKHIYFVALCCVRCRARAHWQ